MGSWLFAQKCGDAAMMLGIYEGMTHGNHLHGPTAVELLAPGPVLVIGCLAVRPAPDPVLPAEVTFGCFEGDEDDFLFLIETDLKPSVRANQRPVQPLIRRRHTSLPIACFFQFKTGEGKQRNVCVHLPKFGYHEAAAILIDAVSQVRRWNVCPRRGLVPPKIETPHQRRLN